MMKKSRATLLYRLNQQDEVIHLSDGWGTFALENDAPELLPEHVLGRSIWDFIFDLTTTQLYRDLFQRARAGRQSTFLFRCDAPDCRRQMEMTISGRKRGELQIKTRSLREEERLPQEVLDRHADRGDDLLRLCGWCNRVDVGGVWEEVETAVTLLGLFDRRCLPLLTHGICDSCYDVMTVIARQRG